LAVRSEALKFPATLDRRRVELPFLKSPSFNGQAYEAERFYRENETNLRQHATLIGTDAAAGAILQIMFIGGLAAVLSVISLDEVRSSFAPGSFVAFMAAMAMLMAPIKRASNLAALLQRGVAAAESKFAVLDQPWEQDGGATELKTVEGRIEFRRVRLTCNPTGEPALDEISLKIESGQTIALVGASGSGKTSLIRLLPRLYEASGGEIRIDGHPITELTLHNLRSHIAYVGQEVVLFNGTVANNIAYGCRRAIDPTRIRQAAAAAKALEFIEALPDGLETLVGQHGVVLSGGQRQRLAIARALLKDAPILILDEATSALDAESEHLLQAALETLRKDRTTLIVARRLSTIRSADQIIVMAKGRIIDRGTHGELIRNFSGYRELHRLHFQTGSSAAIHGDDGPAGWPLE
jgi:subfamily B ATP-binding cassette protein MsbA